MNKLIKNPFSAQKGTVIALCIVLFSWSCKSKMENEVGQLSSFEGTKWKLAGIVDEQTGDIKALEPKNCEKCYTIEFETDSTFSTYSASNGFAVKYEINFETNDIRIVELFGTEKGEIGDGDLYLEALWDLENFSQKNNELRLYYNGNKNYLSFKSLKK